jgi:GNAT superfamily N-acetyltransferase
VLQLIYKLNSSIEVPPSAPQPKESKANFVFIANFLNLCKHLPLLVQRYGISSTLLKLIIKIAMGRNACYLVMYENKIASDGIVTFGICKHYPITPSEHVIGPVFTYTQFRGKGLATLGLRECIASLRDKLAPDAIYIDTSEDNIAMQSVIAKMGFGQHVQSFERPDID